MIPRLFASFCYAALCVPLAFHARANAQQPAAVVSASATATLGKIDATPRPEGLTISIAVSAPIAPKPSRVSNPDRLVFDFPGCQIQGATRHIPVNHGPVKELRVSQFSVHPPVTRVVVDLDAPLDFDIEPSGNGIVVVEIPFPTSQSPNSRSPDSRSPDSRSPDSRSPDSTTSSAAPVRSLPTAVTDRLVIPAAEKRLEPDSPQRPANTAPGAYGLMAKARALKVEDLQAIEEKAAHDDPEAQTMLALAYHAGVLLKRDEGEALRLLHSAADRDYMAAEESLGIFSEAGIGLEQTSPADALRWYQKAAQQGSLAAATNIALMYANGKGVSRDAAQAMSWFRRAAEGGDPSAQYNLALMYERGEGAPQNYRETVRWLTAAADQNLVPAMLDLADAFLQPPNSAITRDVAKAVSYYQKAAELGSPPAQATLGTIFTKGLQGKVDYDEAARWYQKAAAQGEPNGQLGLGVSYALGHGVPVDLEEARRLLTASADQDLIEAQYDLAIMCEEGRGAPADRDLAGHYYQLAADRGLGKAQYRYGLLLARDNKSADERVAAYKWLMLAQDAVKESGRALSDLRKTMTQQEIDQAERQVDDWRLAHRGIASATSVSITR